MSSINTLCIGLRAVSISLSAIVLSISYATQAQTQIFKQQKIETHRQQPIQQTQKEQPRQAISIAAAFVSISFNYNSVGQSQKALEQFPQFLPIRRKVNI